MTDAPLMDPAVKPRKDLGTLALLLGALAGVLLRSLGYFVSASASGKYASVVTQQPWYHPPAIVEFQDRAVHIVGWVARWPQSLVLLAVLVAMAASDRKRPNAWVYAFMAGVIFMSVVFQLLERL